MDSTTPSRTATHGATLAYASLAIVMLLWAGNSIVGRAIRDDVAPFTLAFVRWLGAFLIVAPFAAAHVAKDWPLLVRHAGIVILLAVLGVGAFNALLYSGLHHTTATNGLLLQAAIPPLVLVCNALFFRERSSLMQILGVALAALGVVIIVLRADLHLLRNFSFGIGDLMILAAVVAWALYTSLLRLRPSVHPLSFLAISFLIGVLCMAPLAAFEWLNGDIPQSTPAVLGAFVYVAIFPSVVAYTLFNAAVAKIGAGAAGQTIALMPLLGAGLASLLLREPLHAYHFYGMALIIAGLALGARAAA
ncbi:MAG TPA: DMT family transporter [Verrucomicrobiae bacterium]|nr:DMT family transporter [Verrucomicrobiae bacterium]